MDRLMMTSLLASAMIVGGGVLAIVNHASPMLATTTQPAPLALQAAGAGSAVPSQPTRTPPASSAPAVAPPMAAGGVYRCASGGRTVYSDTPCPGGVPVDVRGAGTVAAPRPAPPAVEWRVQPVPAPAPPVQAHPSAPVERFRLKDECALIRQAIDDIDAQVRVGGTVSVMEYLRQQRRHWEDRRYAAKC